MTTNNSDQTNNKKGSPPKYQITVPDKIPRHHLKPQDAKHQDILHDHQAKLLEKINSGQASPEDHYKFSRIRERLNQITSAAMAKMAAAEQQTKPKFRRSVKNAEENVLTPQHFHELADLQRGKPEKAMLKVQFANGGSILNPVVEHVGDLTHRMSERPTFSTAGYEFVKPKVERSLYHLTRGWEHDFGDPTDSFRSEVAQSHIANAKFLKVPLSEHINKVHKAMDRYAEEHGKLPAYNQAHYHARQAAVEIGKRNYNQAVKHLRKLNNHLGSEEQWISYAHQGLGQPITLNEEQELPPHQVQQSNIQPDALRTMKRRGIRSNGHLLHVLGAPVHLPIILHNTIAQKRPGTSPLIHTEVGAMPHYWMQRTLDPVSGVAHNDEIHITKTGTGLGSQILANQVKHLTGLGFRYIEGVAARENYRGKQTLNGYYTWPRLGYNGLFSGKEKNKLPRELRDADSLHELYRMPGGREWWKANGWGKRVTFDLRPGSDSHKILAAYMKHRENELREAAANPKGPLGNSSDRFPGDGIEEIDLAPWEERALDKAWQEMENKPTANARKGVINRGELKGLSLKSIKSLMDSRSVNHGLVQPGMASHPEQYRSVNVDGVNLRYSEGGKHGAAVVARGLHKIHRTLLNHASDVYFSNRLHQDDITRPGSGFVRATSEYSNDPRVNGSITFYSPSYDTELLRNPWHPVHGIMGTVAHELGHNLAGHISDGLMLGGQQYAHAIDAEPPVSNYSMYHYNTSGRHKGGTGVLADAEDFAEAVKRYHAEPQQLKETHPLKYEAVHQLLESPDHLADQQRHAHGVIQRLVDHGVDPQSFIQHDMQMHYNTRGQ